MITNSDPKGQLKLCSFIVPDFYLSVTSGNILSDPNSFEPDRA